MVRYTVNLAHGGQRRVPWLAAALPLLVLALVGAAAAVPAIAGAQITDTQAPSPPGGLTATPSSGQVALGWAASTDNVAVAGYNVWRRDNPGSNWSQIAQTQATGYTDTTVAAGNGYAYAVRAYDAAGDVSASSAIVTATVPDVAAPEQPDMGATGYRQLIQPTFSPTRVVTVTTASQFGPALADLQAGDEIDVQPMTIPGSFTIKKNLSSYAEIHFAPGVVFSGAFNYRYYALQISNASNIRIYGGDVQNPVNGGCLHIYDVTNITWWHFKFHDCAAGGILGGSQYVSSTGVDLDGEIYNSAFDTSFDPHAEKCTGIHGAYLGATDQDTTPTMSGKFSLYIHDIPCGAALEAGSNLVNSELWIKAVNITYQAQREAAGNAIQFWGGGVRNVTVHDVTGDTLAGRVVETSGMYSCCNSGIVVQYGRGANTLLNRLLRRVNYATDPALTYQDVFPLP